MKSRNPLSTSKYEYRKVFDNSRVHTVTLYSSLRKQGVLTTKRRDLNIDKSYRGSYKYKLRVSRYDGTYEYRRYRPNDCKVTFKIFVVLLGRVENLTASAQRLQSRHRNIVDNMTLSQLVRRFYSDALFFWCKWLRSAKQWCVLKRRSSLIVLTRRLFMHLAGRNSKWDNADLRCGLLNRLIAASAFQYIWFCVLKL